MILKPMGVRLGLLSFESLLISKVLIFSYLNFSTTITSTVLLFFNKKI